MNFPFENLANTRDPAVGISLLRSDGWYHQNAGYFGSGETHMNRLGFTPES
jgi:hypothetical protein